MKNKIRIYYNKFKIEFQELINHKEYITNKIKQYAAQLIGTLATTSIITIGLGFLQSKDYISPNTMVLLILLSFVESWIFYEDNIKHRQNINAPQRNLPDKDTIIVRFETKKVEDTQKIFMKTIARSSLEKKSKWWGSRSDVYSQRTN